LFCYISDFDHGDDGAADVTCSQQVRDCTLTTEDLAGPVTSQNPNRSGLHLAPDEAMKRDRSCSPEGSSSGYPRVGGVLPQPVSDKNTLLKSMENGTQQTSDTDGRVDGQTSDNDGNTWKKNSRDTSRDTSQGDSRTPGSVDESSAFINLSTINDVLLSNDRNPEEFVDYVMHVSQSKLKTRVRQNSRERRKAEVEAKRASSDSSDIDVVEKAKDRGSNRSLHDRGRPVQSVRRPADGRSTHQPKVNYIQSANSGHSSGPLSTDTPSSDDGHPFKQPHPVPRESRVPNHDSNEVLVDRKPVSGSIYHDTNITRVSGSVHGTRNGSVTSGEWKESVSGHPVSGSSVQRISVNSFLVEARPPTSRANSTSVGGGGENDPNGRRKLKSKLSCSKIVTCNLGERSNSLSSLTEQRKGSELTIAKCPSMHELGAKGQHTQMTKLGLQQHVESESVHKDIKTNEKSVTQVSERVMKPGQDELMSERHFPKFLEEKLHEDQEFDEKFTLDVTQSHNLDEKWKSPRPSSVVCRSRSDLTKIENSHVATIKQSDNEKEILKTKRGPPSRKVQFQQTANRPSCESDPNLSSDPDLKSSGSIPKSAAESNKKWLSSTPKLPFSEHDLCQTGMSHIIASPQDSFLQNCTDATLWSSQDKTKDTVPSNQGVLCFNSKPDDGVVLRPVEKKQPCSDDLIQNSGSYRPARSMQNNQGKLATNLSSAATHPLNSDNLPDQHLESNLQSTCRQETQYSGPFKVPERPQPNTLFEEQPSLLCISTREEGKDLLFQTSLSPQRLMTNTLSMTRLDNDRKSLPGLPANQSTPFCQSGHSTLEPRIQEFSETPRRFEMKRSPRESDTDGHYTPINGWDKYIFTCFTIIVFIDCQWNSAILHVV